MSTALQVFTPSSQQLTPHTTFSPVPGAILAADLDGGIPALPDAVEHQRAFPW